MEWIVPFKGRNYSGALAQNFLCRQDHIYIMDNHKAALWCWLNHIATSHQYTIWHIDAHYDTTPLPPGWVCELPSLENLSFEDYEELEHPSVPNQKAIRWDNYLSIFCDRYRDNIEYMFAVTHFEGAKPELCNALWQDVKYRRFVDYFYEEMDEGSRRSIVNIDLDYFFYPRDIGSGRSHVQLLSDTFIDEVFETVSKLNDKGLAEVVTICLSPECCGSWSNSESLIYKLTDKLGLDFVLD